MRELVALAEAREAAAKDDTAALQAARSSLLETQCRGSGVLGSRPTASTNVLHAIPKEISSAPGEVVASSEAPAKALPAGQDGGRAASAAPNELGDDAEDLAAAAPAADGAEETEKTGGLAAAAEASMAAVDSGGPVAAAEVLALAVEGPVPAAEGPAEGASSAGGEGGSDPEAALWAAKAEAEARRASAKKQFAQLRSVCIGAQQARTPAVSIHCL